MPIARFAMVFVSGIFLLLSCSPMPLSDTKAISNRPQWESFIALIKLQIPPLLTSTKINAAGQRVIDTAHKDELLVEQEQMVTALKELSDEIKVIFRYWYVLNGLAVIVPVHLREQIDSLAGVTYLVREGIFTQPELLVTGDNSENSTLQLNSTKFIGAERVHNTLSVFGVDGVEVPVRGNGIRVGIIDSGIDYLHKAFGGNGVVEEYKNNDPTIIEKNSFPTSKVIAGIDLVGAAYNTSSNDFAHQIPQGDADPLDEGVHGTHVAGTVAGIGDGINTHDGVAPEAELVAIKAFGRGSSGESVIIKALDYAIDPNGDFKLDDQVHVASLSLGNSFGNPYSLYQEAVSNALKGGTLVVAAAGNSGENPYAVCSPGTADDAISVAASIDNSESNVKRPAVKFTTSASLRLLAEALVGRGKSMLDVSELTVPLYHIGLADQDLTVEQQGELQGKAALIDRGVVTFDAKIERAVAAGAVAVVIVNNEDGLPSRLRNTKRDDIPIVMIAKGIGEVVKKNLSHEEVRITFNKDFFLSREDVVDSLASFSSYGPRGYDSAIKPEIAAPGVRIVSALTGTGDKGVRYSGTSMATPHISGVVALLRQYRPDVDAALVKGMLLSKAKNLMRANGERYKIYQQGGGRVDAYDAATAEVIFQPSALSLGETTVVHQKKIAGNFRVVNLSARNMHLSVHAQVGKHLTFTLPAQIELQGKGERLVDFTLMIDARQLTKFYSNLDGFIELHEGDKMVAKMPLLLGVRKLARVSPTSALIFANSVEDAYGAVIDVELENHGASDGEAVFLNLLGLDTRAQYDQDSRLRGRHTCDLQSAGYRVLNQQKVEGKTTSVIQFAAKLYHPLTTWHTCEIVVQFDSNGDGIVDQELVGRRTTSYLYDAHKMRALRLQYEKKATASRNYSPALVSSLSAIHYNHSTLLMVNADLEKISKDASGNLRFKLAAVRADTGTTVLADTAVTVGDFVPSSVTDTARHTPILPTDDFLDRHIDSWQVLSPTLDGVGFGQIPEHVSIPKGGATTVSLVKGGDPATRLIVYFPHNASTFSHLRTDHQSRIIDLSYL